MVQVIMKNSIRRHEPALFFTILVIFALLALLIALSGTVHAQQVITPTSVSIVPQPGTPVLSVATTSGLAGSAFAIKAAGSGQLYGWSIFNAANASCFLQFFNIAAGSVTLGTTAPNLIIGFATLTRGDMPPIQALLDGTNGLSAAFTTTATGSTPCATASPFNAWYSTR